MQESVDNNSNPIMLIVTLSVITVGIVVIIFAALFIISKSTSDASTGIIAPYSIGARPLPEVNAVETILPEKLGNFKRGPITGDIQNYSASYTSGTDKIDVSGSQGVSLRAAQVSVANIDQISSAAIPVQHLLNKDPSFVFISGAGPVRLAWSHNRWFFDVKANSQAVLDAFMRVFKY